MVTERNNCNDQEISAFNRAIDGVDDTQFSSEMISFLNQKDKIVKTTKHVDPNSAKETKKTIGESYLNNNQPDDKFKLNIERMKQQFDRTKIKTSETSCRNYQNCYFDQNKNQKQSVYEFFNLHKTPSQSDLLVQNFQTKIEKKKEMSSNITTAKLLKEKAQAVKFDDNPILTPEKEGKDKVQKQSWCLSQEIKFLSNSNQSNETNTDCLLKAQFDQEKAPNKSKPYAFKHPLITISKPSKEEIEKVKERQQRRNLSQYTTEDSGQQYNDSLGGKNIPLNTIFNFKNHNSNFGNNRFFTKRTKMYNTYLNEGINCNGMPRCDLLIPNSKSKKSKENSVKD